LSEAEMILVLGSYDIVDIKIAKRTTPFMKKIKEVMFMSKNELVFRWRYFWYVFKIWVHGALTAPTPIKGMKLEKRLISYGLVEDGVQKEYHEGTFWEFTKWIITHERIGIM